MGREFKYVILGGGTAAGYAAHEFLKRGIEKGELCIISEEQFPPYERPALSKGYLMPDGQVRLPSFHTCVGVGEERHTGKWYKDQGIELLLGTRVVAAQVKLSTLTTAAGETIGYHTLIVATGSMPVRLEDFGVSGADCGRICYLRDIADADRLVQTMAECKGGRAVVIGGGYIGMEATAALVANSIHPTMVFPESHCMARLFTKEMAEWYEEEYKARGVDFVKGSVIIGFESKKGQTQGSKGVVGAVILKDGTKVPADMVVVGVGIRPNTDLFRGQLAMQEPGGGLRVNSDLCSVSASNIYVIGDAAAFPLPLYNGAVRRMEHVDHARKSAAAAVEAILSPPHSALPYDYLPYFYSRVFNLSWQFFGDHAGDCVLFGSWQTKLSSTDAELKGSSTGTGPAGAKKFGAYFVDKGRVVGAFLEGGSKEEYAAIAVIARLQPKVGDKKRLADLGTEFALREVRDEAGPRTGDQQGSSGQSQSAAVVAATPKGGSRTAAAPGKGASAAASTGGAAGLQQSGSATVAAEDVKVRRLHLQPRAAKPAPEEAGPPCLLMQASVGVALAVGVTALAIWHGRYLRKRW